MSLCDPDDIRNKRRCARCGVYIFSRVSIAKCPDCAKQIAQAISKDFQENIGHHLTEAILATGNEKMLGQIETTKPIELTEVVESPTVDEFADVVKTLVEKKDEKHKLDPDD